MIFILILFKYVISSTLVAQEFNSSSYQGWYFDISYQSQLTCKGQQVFGAFQGTNFLLTKLFVIDIPHSSVNVDFNFISPKDVTLYMFINDKLFQDFDVNNAEQCDENTTSNSIHFQHYHTGITLALTISVESAFQIPQYTSKWAISDLQIHVEECPADCLICEEIKNEISCVQWKLHSQSWITPFKNQLGMDGWLLFDSLGSSNCANLPIIGGYGKLGAQGVLKKVIKLRPHYRLRITVMWIKIDSWDNESGIIYIDGVEVWKQLFQSYVDHGGNICGNKSGTYATQFISIDVALTHTGNQAEIIFTTNLDQGVTDESFGLRGLQIFFAPCHIGCAECKGSEMYDCLKCSKGYLLEDYFCFSQEGEAFHLLTKEFFDSKFSDLNKWEISGVSAEREISLCQDQSIVGGYSVFGQGAIVQKQYFIPPHSKLRLMLTFYKIDSWDEEQFMITIDDIIIWTSTYSHSVDSNLCGISLWSDEKYYIDVTIDHSKQNSTLKFNSSLDSNSYDESWGFRELIIIYEATPYDSSASLKFFHQIYQLPLILQLVLFL